MSKGKIILLPFPFTDLSGHKVRPALVLHAPTKGEDYIVAFISSIDNSKSGKFDLPIPASIENGLKVDSIIKINKLATLDRKIILGELGHIETPLLLRVNKKIKDLFGI